MLLKEGRHYFCLGLEPINYQLRPKFVLWDSISSKLVRKCYEPLIFLELRKNEGLSFQAGLKLDNVKRVSLNWMSLSDSPKTSSNRALKV